MSHPHHGPRTPRKTHALPLSSQYPTLTLTPSTITDSELYSLSQRELSKRLPAATGTSATFKVYLRWLDVHRKRKSRRTEHWRNTVMHWVQSLASRRFTLDQVIVAVETWKVENGPFGDRYRAPPTESEIRKAFEDDPKTNMGRKERVFEGERESERESMRERESERESEKRKESYRMEKMDSRMGERDRGRDRTEGRERKDEEWWESSRDRRVVDKDRYDGPPPANYICNRCGKKGHHLQVCPTNLDPAFDRAPDDTYECEICHKRGDHFKSLCPKNTDPYSIIQKRKAKGIIVTPPRRSLSQRDDREQYLKAQRDRETERHERDTGGGRLTEYSSNSSARGTPPSSKKRELLESLQGIEEKKQRLFREQSDDIGDMIRGSTVLRSGEKKRDRLDYEAGSVDSPTTNRILGRKKARLEESERMSPASRFSERQEGAETPQTRDSSEQSEQQGNDTDMQGIENGKSETPHLRRTSSVGFALRPIGLSPGSMISDSSSSDGMEIDELISIPMREYSPFVQHMMRKRPEMSEVVNAVKKRKTAREMWKEADKMRKQRSKNTRTPSRSEEYGRLTPVPNDEIMMQFDGACDDTDYSYDQHQDYDQNHTMTSPTKEKFTSSSSRSQRTYKNPRSPSSFHSSPTSNSHFPPQNLTHNENMTLITNTTTASPANGTAANGTTSTSKPTTTPTTTPPTTSSPRVHFPPPIPSPASPTFPSETRDDSSAFKNFATQQSKNDVTMAEARAQIKAKGSKATFDSLKAFSSTFKLTTPVPEDLVEVLARDEKGRDEIREKRKEVIRERSRRDLEAYGGIWDGDEEDGGKGDVQN